MADKNTTEVSAAIQALAAVVGEAEFKQLIDDNFAKNCVFKKDVASAIPAASPTELLDFTDIDYLTVAQTGNLIYSISGVNQGNVKYLKITKLASETITFTASVFESSGSIYMNTVLTEVLFMVINKDGVFRIIPLTNLTPIASEDYEGIVEKATTAESLSGAADKFIDAALLQAITSLETRVGLIERATQAEAEAETDNERAMTPLRVSQQTTKKFDNWQSVAYDAGDYSGGWTGLATGFSLRYLIVGKTVTINMNVQGTSTGASEDLQYTLPLAINLIEGSVGLGITGRKVGGTYRQISGAFISGRTVIIKDTANFESGVWGFNIGGTWEVS